MWNRNTLGILFLLLACVGCFGQSSYKGLTPGKSIKADVERVLGKPVKSVSQTLIEYKSPDYLGKTYVQYSDDSAGARVERIELMCMRIRSESGDKASECTKIWDKEFDSYDSTKRVCDESLNCKYIYYFGSSRFMVFTRAADDQIRWAFYSKELYEAAAPQLVGCTGTIFGDWETDLGRLKIVRTGDLASDSNGLKFAPVRGTYSTNNGTFVGRLERETVYAEWKDDTGTGKLSLHYLPLSSGEKVSGEWKRTTGTGPATGTWDGKCVDLK